MLQYLVIFLIIILITVLRALGQAPENIRADNSRSSVEVLKLEELGRQKSLRGETKWDDLIEAGAYMIGPDGSVVIFDPLKTFPSYPVKAFELSEMIARPFGMVVVVTGLAVVEFDLPNRKIPPQKMRFMNVWKRNGRSWKLVVTERTSVREATGNSSP